MPKPPNKNTPPAGTPVYPEMPDEGWESHQPTPPPFDVDELIRRLWPLRKAGDLLIELQTKVQLLEETRDGTTQKIAIDAVEKDLRSLAADIVDIKGTSGNNGKLGALKERVDKAEARRWTFIMAIVGMILTAGTLAIGGGRWVGQLENRVEQLEDNYTRVMKRKQEEILHDRK